MIPIIKTLPQKKLIGKRMNMSLTHGKTPELFKSFMPRKKEISSSVGNDVFCMRVYDPSYDFKNFDPSASFDKWAAVEVINTDVIPSEMESYLLPGGLYAVFTYKGSSKDTSPFQFIFGTWLPNEKEYELDNRPHFEILGEKYKNNDLNSEEEIWIPVKLKFY
ncbi:MAG: GyrI-like domain-containing protein [Bacteroidota bacterium]|nr:GyrI-like domain-containing protein [Bacteroidota bacterium]